MKKVTVFLVAVVIIFGITSSVTITHAQNVNSNPYIHTTNTPDGGVSIVMDLPNNFKGQVNTVYKDGKWQSYATTTPLSELDISNIQNNIKKQQLYMDQLFTQEQQMFNEEQNMMQNMFQF